MQPLLDNVRKAMLLELIQDGDLSPEKGARRLGIPVSQIPQAMKDWQAGVMPSGPMPPWRPSTWTWDAPTD